MTEVTQESIKWPDPLAEAAFKQLQEWTEQRNATVGKINAAKGDPFSLLENLRETSENPKVVKLRNEVEKCQEVLAKLETEIDALLKPEMEQIRSDVEGKTADLEAQVKDLDAKCRAASTYFRKSYGDELSDKVMSLLPKHERAKGFSTKGSASSRRVRGYNAVVDVNGEVTEYQNLSGVAKELNVETSVLQEGFFRAAKTEKLSDAPDVVTWSVTYKDGDAEKTATVTATRTPTESKSEAKSEDAA